MENRIRSGKAADVMTTEVITGQPGESLGSITARMDRGGISEMPIVDDRGRLRGVIDYRMIVKHRRSQPSMKAENLMYMPPEASPDTPLVDIAEHMISHDLRAIPLVEDGRLVGIVSRSDLVRFLKGVPQIRDIPVEEVMTPGPRTVTQNDQIRTALNVLKDIDERNVPVVDDNRVVGVIGVKDISPTLMRPMERSPRWSRGREKRLTPEVRSLMNEPIVLKRPVDLGTVLDTMVDRGISMVPILEGEGLVGVVTHYDVMEFIARYREREEALVQFSGLEAEPEVFEAMYQSVGRLFDRISSFVRPQTLTAHITEHGEAHDDMHAFFEVRMRMNTRGALFTSTRSGWDLLVVLDECLQSIEIQARKDHERRDHGRR